MRTLQTLVLAGAAIALSGVSAHAGILTVDFDPTTTVAVPGQTVTVRGTITNIGSGVVDLNGCNVNLSAGLTADCSIFLSGTGAPLFLTSGDSATADLFQFTPDNPFLGAIGRQPPGTFTITGTEEVSGYDGDTQNDLLDAQVQVTVTPEPSTLALLITALCCTVGTGLQTGTSRAKRGSQEPSFNAAFR